MEEAPGPTGPACRHTLTRTEKPHSPLGGCYFYVLIFQTSKFLSVCRDYTTCSKLVSDKTGSKLSSTLLPAWVLTLSTLPVYWLMVAAARDPMMCGGSGGVLLRTSGGPGWVPQKGRQSALCRSAVGAPTSGGNVVAPQDTSGHLWPFWTF